MDETTSSTFIPNIYKNSYEETAPVSSAQSAATKPVSKDHDLSIIPLARDEQQGLPENILNYINSHFERLIKPHFETFEHEDIKPDIVACIDELHGLIDNTVKKTGDVISGPLHILSPPQAKLDAVNKEYVDWLFLTLMEKFESKLSKNSDLDLNHFKIKNIQSPMDLNDAVNKNYVDQKFENLNGYLNPPIQHVFSKGQIMIKKTFFFNPGFICPQKIHITSVGFSTSPYKFKIGEKIKLGDINPTKLYFMINNEIRSEYVIDKDVQLGHILKEFDNPIIFEKGDNFMMVVETMIEDASVNIAFY